MQTGILATITATIATPYFQSFYKQAILAGASMETAIPAAFELMIKSENKNIERLQSPKAERYVETTARQVYYAIRDSEGLPDGCDDEGPFNG